MVDFEEQNTDTTEQGEEVYDATDLQPGGAGKQGDQQEMGQGREPRRDKSHNEGGSDKMHG